MDPQSTGSGFYARGRLFHRRIVSQAGDYAEDQPFRFSTKYYDVETGLGYWGYRYYSPGIGAVDIAGSDL